MRTDNKAFVKRLDGCCWLGCSWLFFTALLFDDAKKTKVFPEYLSCADLSLFFFFPCVSLLPLFLSFSLSSLSSFIHWDLPFVLFLHCPFLFPALCPTSSPHCYFCLRPFSSLPCLLSLPTCLGLFPFLYFFHSFLLFCPPSSHFPSKCPSTCLLSLCFLVILPF